MTTREDVLDAIDRIEQSGHGGAATRAAQLDLLMSPPDQYDRILDRLRAEFPKLLPPAAPPPPAPADPEQQGVAARAMKTAEAALAQQQSATAEFDRRVIDALLHAHTTTRRGRSLLDDLESQIDSVTRSFDLSTPAGAREFQGFLLTKLGEIIAVVEEADGDDTAKQDLAAAWAALYAAHTGQDPAAPAGPADPPARDGEPDRFDEPPATALPFDEPEPDDPNVPRRGGAPVGPGFGGELPGLGAIPTGGVPGGLPLAGLLQPQRGPTPQPEFDGEPTQVDDAPPDPLDEAADDDQPTTAESAPPVTVVTLPGGETVAVATPQLAAVLQAAVDGTPIADAFRRQGITIPPAGTPVTGPLDQSQVSPGDIGMFTDRHALVLGNGKALLDGQIQQIANVRGPSFLGWQHPPTLVETAPPQPPTPTRPSAVPA